MIIDRNIDRTLWLILNTDKKNRDRIVDFLSNIPNEFKNLIQNKLSYLDKCRNTGEKKKVFLYGEHIVDDLLYWFEIQPEFNEIDLGYKKVIDGVYKDMFEMSLSFDSDLSIKNFDKKYIGRIEYDKKVNIVDNVGSILEFSENIYNLHKTPFGYIITSFCNKEMSDLRYFGNNISLDDELCLDEIKNINNVNRLVRRKRK